MCTLVSFFKNAFDRTGAATSSCHYYYVHLCATLTQKMFFIDFCSGRTHLPLTKHCFHCFNCNACRVKGQWLWHNISVIAYSYSRKVHLRVVNCIVILVSSSHQEAEWSDASPSTVSVRGTTQHRLSEARRLNFFSTTLLQRSCSCWDYVYELCSSKDTFTSYLFRSFSLDADSLQRRRTRWKRQSTLHSEAACD